MSFYACNQSSVFCVFLDVSNVFYRIYFIYLFIYLFIILLLFIIVHFSTTVKTSYSAVCQIKSCDYLSYKTLCWYILESCDVRFFVANGVKQKEAGHQ